MAGIFSHRIAILLDGIPFVDHHDRALIGFQDVPGNVGILSGDSGGRVDHQ